MPLRPALGAALPTWSFSLLQEPVGGDVASVFVGRFFGRRLFGASRMFAIPGEIDVLGDLLQQRGELSRCQRAEHRPVLFGNRNHHAVVGAPDFQRQVIAGDGLLHRLFAVERPQRGLQHGNRVERQQRQTKREQGCLRITQRRDLALQRLGDFLKRGFGVPIIVPPKITLLSS